MPRCEPMPRLSRRAPLIPSRSLTLSSARLVAPVALLIERCGTAHHTVSASAEQSFAVC